MVVFGAYGHTGRFVVSELMARGFTPILSGRDATKLNALAAIHGDLEVRPASIDDLDRALADATAVVHCAGPFAYTAAPMIEAALRNGTHYLDLTAEVEVAAATFEAYADRAGIVIAPAMGFYGALGDLLATAAMGDWAEADEISIAYALSSWKPTAGTRATIQTSTRRRNGDRIVYSNRRMEMRKDPAPIVDWTFPAPIGTRKVVAEFTTADSVTIPRHLTTAELRTYMTQAPLADLTDPDPPVGIDERGRSDQTFLVEAVVRRRGAERRAVVRGRDIYAITAPIVVEALQRILDGQAGRAGVVTAGQAFDAIDFLKALEVDLTLC